MRLTYPSASYNHAHSSGVSHNHVYSFGVSHIQVPIHSVHRAPKPHTSTHANNAPHPYQKSVDDDLVHQIIKMLRYNIGIDAIDGLDCPLWHIAMLSTAYIAMPSNASSMISNNMVLCVKHDNMIYIIMAHTMG
jgi:hypothetical protein